MTGPQTGRLSFKLPSTMDSVAEVEAAAEKLIQSAGMDEDESFKVVMAVRESALGRTPPTPLEYARATRQQ